MIGLLPALRPVQADDLTITSIQGTGALTWSNSAGVTGPTDFITSSPIAYQRVGSYAVEWTSSVTNEWNSNWQGLEAIYPKGTNMMAGVPMLFRLKYTPPESTFWPTISGRQLRFEDVAAGVTNHSVWQYMSSFNSPSSGQTYSVLERSVENSNLKAYYVARITAEALYIVDNNSGIEGVAAKTGPEEQPWTYYSNGKLVTTAVLALTNRPNLLGMPPTNSPAICLERRTAAGSHWYEWFLPGLGLVAMWDQDGSSERLISVLDP